MKRLVRSTKTGIFCTQCDKSIPVNTSRIVDGGMHSHYECLNKLKSKVNVMVEMRIKPSMSMFLNNEELLKAQKEWYQEYSERLEGLVSDFITEYCEREYCENGLGEDLPLPAKDQECEVVSNAMKLLDI